MKAPDMRAELCKSCSHTKVCTKDKNLVGDIFVAGNPMIFDNHELWLKYKEREAKGFPCDDYEPAVGKFQDLFNRVMDGMEKMIEAGQTPSEIIINGRKYGKLVGDMYNPHLFGMAVKSEINMPDDYDFIIQHAIRPKTNVDRIRQMSDEELAEYMNGLRMHNGCPNNGALNCKPYCDACWLEWLKKEVEE